MSKNITSLNNLSLLQLLSIETNDLKLGALISKELIIRHDEYSKKLTEAIKTEQGLLIYYTILRIASNLKEHSAWNNDPIVMARNTAIIDLINAINIQLGINQTTLILKRQKGFISQSFSTIIKYINKLI